MPRFLIVSTDPADLTVRGGPVEWDGATPYIPPDGTRLVLEAVALAGGYTMPARPQVRVTEATLRERAGQALDVNAAYLAISSPSNAQIAAQVGRLTRECSALIRLLLRRLDSDEGT